MLILSINSGEMRVEYCPTGDMLADIFTKPRRRMQDAIMNIDPQDGPASMQNTAVAKPRSVLTDETEKNLDGHKTWSQVNERKVSGKAQAKRVQGDKKKKRK